MTLFVQYLGYAKRRFVLELHQSKTMTSLTTPELVFALHNGETVPAIGLGTFQGDFGNSKVKDVVLAALKKGYRHIDCATAYGNEVQVGQAIHESGIAREELFVTTKLSVLSCNC
jgi:diketogulonate reductase-like aldo/keto reductase